MNQKDKAISFLKMASAGPVDEAYERYIHPDFIHHNPYFKGDRESLRKGMEENAGQFPDKSYQILHAVEEEDLVAIHGKVTLSEDQVFAVIHLCRFEAGKIREMWEASQEVLSDSPNENGLF